MNTIVEQQALVNSRRPWNTPVEALKEKVDLQALAWCYINYDKLTLKKQKINCEDVSSEVYKRELKKYIETFTLEKYPIGEKRVPYTQGVLNEGRFMARTPLSLQTITRQIRHTISRGHLVDIDVVSCHPCILYYNLSKRYNFEFPELGEYLEGGKDKFINELMTLNQDKDKDYVKSAILSVLNGGGFTKFENPSEWYKRYYNKAQEVLSKIVKHLDDEKPEYKLIAEAKKGKDYPFLNGSIVNQLLLDYENRIAYYMRKYLEEKGFTIVSLCHDGLMVEKDAKLDNTLLSNLELYIKEESNIKGIKLKYKEMDEGFHIEPLSLQAIDKEHKVFEKTIDYNDYHILKELFRGGDDGLSKIFSHNVKHIIKTVDTGDFSGYKWNKDTRLWNSLSKEFMMNEITGILLPLIRPYIDAVNNMDPGDEKKALKKEWTSIYKYIQSLNGCKNIWGKARTILYDERFKELLDNISYFYPLKDGYKIDLRSREVSIRTIDDFWTFESPCSYIQGETEDKRKIFKYLKTVCCEADKEGNDLVADNEAHFTKWLFKLFGYCLTAEVSDRRMYICHGRGCNSKSVIMDMLSKIMNNGYAPLSKSAIIQKDKVRSAATPELMSFKYARMATVNETNEKEKLDASIIKGLTGNDLMKVRDLYKSEITIKPKAKIFLISNHKPEINSEDKAIKDRVVFIPFKQTFDKTPENTAYVNSIVENDINYFFSLMVDYGSQWWIDRDLKLPAICEMATSEFIDENNDIDPFIAEMILLNPTEEQLEEAQLKEGHKSKGLYLSSAYSDYIRWTEDNDKPCRKQGEFKKALEIRGFCIKQSKGNLVIKKDKSHLVLKSKISLEEEEDL